MDLQRKQFTTEVGGKKLTLEISKIAPQANAAILGTYGDTSVLVTVTMGKEDRVIDYLPLVVDYEEKFYAAGKIIGSRFIRREGRPSEEAILSGRLIDRSLRPLFNHNIRRDIQIVNTVLSYDEENDPDFVALITASTALAISEIPWNGPLAGLKVAIAKNGETLINPNNSKIKELIEANGLEFESFIAGTKDKINMIELSGKEALEEKIISGFASAHEEIKKLVSFQEKIIKETSRPKENSLIKTEDKELKNKIHEFLKDKLEDAIYVKEKGERQNKLELLKEDLFENLKQEEGIELSDVAPLFEEEVDELVHKNILEKEKRPDARKLDEIRELHAETGLFKRLHGSALFIRGNTQALAVATLAPPGAEQLVETMEVSAKRRFMLHYNFPPYSTGETGRMGGPGRREIGHGALAEKAIKQMIPTQEEFPYTIRVVSEVLSSNGSSSMATTCASSMALMDAGVPIKKPVAGIAMGLVLGKDDYKILTDIQGPEDHYGDMDCKVAGTDSGITAIQMDVKVEGVTTEILKKVFEQARKARLEILEVIKKAIPEPRKQVSSFAPVVVSLNINPEQIGEVIGPGGKMINGIIKDTGVLTIDIEQTGKVFVAAPDAQKANAAIDFIKSLTKEFKPGETVEGTVVKLLDFGAIVDIGGGKDGMIHISEIKDGFVEKITDVIKVGDFVRAKVVKVENGKIGLSIKALKE